MQTHSTKNTKTVQIIQNTVLLLLTGNVFPIKNVTYFSKNIKTFFLLHILYE
jgi:hypothetical protein